MHHIEFGQLQGQHQRSLLARRAVAPGRRSPQQQFDLIAVGAYQALAEPFLLAALLQQLVEQGGSPDLFPSAGRLGLQPRAAPIEQLQYLLAAAQPLLP